MNRFVKIVLAAAVSVPFYAGVSTAVLYTLSETWGLLLPRMDTLQSVILLVVYIAILSIYRKIQHISILIVASGILIFTGILCYKNFKALKRTEGTRPKIFFVSPTGGIQAQIVEIRGLRFERPSEKGKVVLGQDTMNIQNWKDNIIIAEQPLTQQKGRVEMYVERGDGMRSNRVTYEIKDPAEIVQ